MAEQEAETTENTENAEAEVVIDESLDVHSMNDAALDALLAEDEGEPAEQVEVELKPEPEITPDPAPVNTEVEKLAKQVADKEAFIQQRNAEIGELRRQAASLQEQLAKVNPEELDDLYTMNPSEAVNQVLAIRENQARLEQLEWQAQVKENETVIKDFVPDFEDLMDDMAETLKEMKYAPEVIQNFKNNPYAGQPAILVNLAARAKLAKENKSLKAEIELLKKAPGEVLKKVEQAARQSLTAATGKAGGSAAITSKQVHQMTAAEIEAALNEPD